MTREEREMDLWTGIYNIRSCMSHEAAKADADAALTAFRAAFPESQRMTKQQFVAMTGYKWREKHPADSYPGEDAP